MTPDKNSLEGQDTPINPVTPEAPNTSPLEEFIEDLQGELRTGGGATLDELFDLAQALQSELQRINERLDKIERFTEEQTIPPIRVHPNDRQAVKGLAQLPNAPTSGQLNQEK